ncbi:18795_t:CDS:1, partial [Racocetra persica]
MTSETGLLTLIHKLQNPIPQFVLGTLPILAIVATNPYKSLLAKLLWFARCLGSPFFGLFYFCNIECKPIEMCSYWLEANNFICTKDDNGIKVVEEGETKGIRRIRPFGHYALIIKPTESQEKVMNDWVSKASLLDRLSSLSSLYYISVGIFAVISKALSPCMDDDSVEDWPFIPLLFIWTLPAINVRIKYGNVVTMVDSERLNGKIEIVNDLIKRKTSSSFTAIIALISVLLPWFAVIIAYFVPP